jgi:hypothetical protein
MEAGFPDDVEHGSDPPARPFVHDRQRVAVNVAKDDSLVLPGDELLQRNLRQTGVSGLRRQTIPDLGDVAALGRGLETHETGSHVGSWLTLRYGATWVACKSQEGEGSQEGGHDSINWGTAILLEKCVPMMEMRL